MKLLQNERDSSLFEINVTPFIDVLLVLLVIILITAPFLSPVITVNLPKANGVKTTMSKKLLLSLTKSNRIQIQGKRYSFIKAIRYIEKWKRLNKRGEILLEADKKIAYGKVVSLFSKLKNSHISKVNLLITQS